MSDDDLTKIAQELLARYNIASVQQLARQLRITPAGLSKPKLVAIVAPRLFKPETIDAAIADLEPIEREVLNRLVLLGGMAHQAAIRRQLNAEGSIEPRTKTTYGFATETGSYRQRGSRKFEDILARLGVLGLLFSRSPYGSGNIELTRPSEYLYIPEPVLRRLPPVTLPPLPVIGEPTHIAGGDPASLLHDEYAFVSAAREEPLQLTKGGGLMKRAFVRVDGTFQVSEGAASVKAEGDLARLPLLRALAQGLGLLVERGGALEPGSEADAMLSLPWGERLTKLYTAYRETDTWSELSRLQGITLTPKANMYQPHFRLARLQILDQVATLPVGRWIAIDALQDRFRRYAYDFLLARSWSSAIYYHPRVEDWEPYPYDGSNQLGVRMQSYSGQVNWETVEGTFIRTVVIEALHWLGMVDVGSADGTAPTAFRITEVGDALLHGRMPQAPNTETNVVVQPNFQIFAFPPTGEDVLFTLERFAKRVRAEQVTEYRLTRESVYAAQRAGMETSAVIDYLESVSRTGVPQNVRRTLEEWGQQHDRIVIRRSTPLLQVAAADILDELYADPLMSPLLGRRLAPTMALVPIEHAETVFVRLLERNGPLPALSEGNDATHSGVGRPAGAAIQVQPDGMIQLREPVPSAYVLHCLRQFTEEAPGREVRLSRGSLQRAAAQGYAPERIVSVLEHLQGTPLSAEAAALIRRWAKDYGQGAMADVTLLQVETPEILMDLLGDPEIAGMLQTVAGSPTLAVVQKKDAVRVRKLLDERGMELKKQLQ